MKTPTKTSLVEKLAHRISVLCEQLVHIDLTIEFPPPGCRNVSVWCEEQGELREKVTQQLARDRDALRYLTGQTMLAFG